MNASFLSSRVRVCVCVTREGFRTVIYSKLQVHRRTSSLRGRCPDKLVRRRQELEVLDVPEDVTPFLLSGYNAVMSVLGKVHARMRPALSLADGG